MLAVAEVVAAVYTTTTHRFHARVSCATRRMPNDAREDKAYIGVERQLRADGYAACGICWQPQGYVA